MRNKRIKNAIAALAVCAATIAPLASCPGMVYAGDSRPLVTQWWYDDMHFESRLDPETLHVIKYKGVHYITFTRVSFYDDVMSTPFGTIPLGKKYWGTEHVMYRYDTDGSIIGNSVGSDKRDKISDDELIREFEAEYGNSENPKDWALSGMSPKEVPILEDVEKFAKFIYVNYPSIVTELKSHDAADMAFLKEKEAAKKAEEDRKRKEMEQARLDAFLRQIKPKVATDLKNVKDVGPAPARYTWDMFMWEGVTPPAYVDINELLDGVWLETYHEPESFWHRATEKNMHDYSALVRFVPYFFVDDQTGEILGGTVMKDYIGQGYFYNENARCPLTMLFDWEIIPDGDGGILFDKQFKETDEDSFEHKIYCNRENSIVGKRSAGNHVGRFDGEFRFDDAFNVNFASTKCFRVLEYGIDLDHEQDGWVPTGAYLSFAKATEFVKQ